MTEPLQRRVQWMCLELTFFKNYVNLFVVSTFLFYTVIWLATVVTSITFKTPEVVTVICVDSVLTK